MESDNKSRIKKTVLLVIPLLLLTLASGDPASINWQEEDANITKTDVLNGLDYDEVNADQQMTYQILKQIEERSGWINTTTHVNTNYNVSIEGNLTISNNLTILENVRILKTLYGGSPLQIGDDVRFVNVSLDTLFSIYTANTEKNFSNVPAGFNNSLIFETSRINNEYRMEVCFWDNQTSKMILCLNEGEPLRATTVRRSLQVVGNTTVKPNDENFTLCEGANYIDCSTDVTGADLYVQDDIEAQSIYANENLTVNNVKLTGTIYNDLRVSVTSTKLGGTKDPDFAKFKDDGAASQGVFTYLFDRNTEEELYLVTQLPHSYKLNTSVEAHVHWSPLTTSTLGVGWGIECTWSNQTDVFPDTTIYRVNVNASGTAYDHQLTSFGNLVGSASSTSAVLLCRVFRDATNATDSYDGDVALYEIDFHYQVDGFGSDGLIGKSW